MAAGELDYRVLGPVTVLRDGHELPIGGRRQQALLALLLRAAGRVVSADWLVEELWGDGPATAASTLPSAVSRLRAALGAGATIEATASGYALRAASHQVDAARFEALVEDGRRALVDSRPRRALDLLGFALGLWRGRPYAGVADGGALGAEADRLEELRLFALETRIDAELALGADEALVPELESLVRQHPYRERIWGQLMVSLYRAGRQAEALSTYATARSALVDDLGLDPGPALEELQRQVLRQEVPGPSVVVAAPRSLPAPLTTFVGRTAELEDVERLLDGHRLVTLTGVGGVGKTRVALELAGRLADDFRDGAWFVDLSAVAAGAPVGPTVAAALGLPEQAETASGPAVREHLRDRRLLLILDNAEHVREAAASLTADLLRACPRVTVLATSREPLGIPGEVDYPVAPLRLPDADASAEGILESEAVQLFVARAREQRPQQLDAAAVATAARICADLDGLPLAVELAAARVKALGLEDIASRLSDRFRFLVSWRRLTVARHRTLREAMDWSFELLQPDEQALLARLSVFAGPFPLDAVAQVCLEGDLDRSVVLLERLVGASLVETAERGGRIRYRLLETVRQYAAERLPTDQAERVRQAHARYYLGVAVSADLSAAQRGSGQRLDLAIEAEANLRSALGWAVEARSVAFGLELATSLERFWVTHDPAEGMRWFEALFALSESAAAPAAIRAAGLRAFGGAADIAGDDDRAQALYEASLGEFRAVGDEAGEAVLLHRLAISALRRGDLGRARELALASHAIHLRRGDGWGQAQTLGTLGAIDRDSGDRRLAFEQMTGSLALARAAGVTWWVSGLQAELANLLLADVEIGDVPDDAALIEAQARARESLALADEMGDRAGRLFGVGLLARIAAERHDVPLARRLWSAVADEDGVAPLGGWRRQRDGYRAWFAERLRTPAAVEPESPDTTSLDDAVALALGRLGTGAAPAG